MEEDEQRETAVSATRRAVELDAGEVMGLAMRQMRRANHWPFSIAIPHTFHGGGRTKVKMLNSVRHANGSLPHL